MVKIGITVWLADEMSNVNDRSCNSTMQVCQVNRDLIAEAICWERRMIRLLITGDTPINKAIAGEPGLNLRTDSLSARGQKAQRGD